MHIKSRLVPALAAAALLTVLAGPAVAKGSKLIGTWKVQKMLRGGKPQPLPPGFAMTTQFKKNHVFVTKLKLGARRNRVKGSWKLVGKTLISKAKGKTSKVKIAFVGGKLHLTKLNRPGEKVILRRVK